MHQQRNPDNKPYRQLLTFAEKSNILE